MSSDWHSQRAHAKLSHPPLAQKKEQATNLATHATKCFYWLHQTVFLFIVLMTWLEKWQIPDRRLNVCVSAASHRWVSVVQIWAVLYCMYSSADTGRHLPACLLQTSCRICNGAISSSRSSSDSRPSVGWSVIWGRPMCDWRGSVKGLPSLEMASLSFGCTLGSFGFTSFFFFVGFPLDWLNATVLFFPLALLFLFFILH